MKSSDFPENSPQFVTSSDNRIFGDISGDIESRKFVQLKRVGANALDQLKLGVMDEIENYFLKRGTTCLSSQLTVLETAVSAILSGAVGTVTAVPISPGGGKSTLIRALLKKLSTCFCSTDHPIAKHFGGVIIVVEKSSEGHELEDLCNDSAEQRVAVLVESANDFNLHLGHCPNGTATRFDECRRRDCPDYDSCRLMQCSQQLHETPILIMLHARYQRFMESIETISFWRDAEGRHYPRTLLLIDELPDMFEEGSINLGILNAAATEIDQLKPSYQYGVRMQKQELIYQWNRCVQHSFVKLQNIISTDHGPYGLLSREDLESAGFQPSSLQKLKEKLKAYAPDTRAEQVVNTLLECNHCYSAVANTVSIFLPRLKELHGLDRPATFIFSGTATLSPELTHNSNIRVLNDCWEESYSRLTFYSQRGDAVKPSKTDFRRSGHLQAIALWISHVITQMREKHQRILVVTFKEFSEPLWSMLQKDHDILLPYIDGCGCPQPKLPYYGGLNGSNQYLESSCVICAGLNRFEPKDYLMRTLALDEDGTLTTQIQQTLNDTNQFRLDQMPGVMDIQDITLARDIVQLVFRSALRHHYSTNPIDCWLLQPPQGVLSALKDYFKNCNFIEVPTLPESCIQAAMTGKTYAGGETLVSKMLKWLHQWDGSSVSPNEIRQATGLSQNQFKEVRKHPEIQKFFEAHVTTTGSGRHTAYRRTNNKEDCA